MSTLIRSLFVNISTNKSVHSVNLCRNYARWVHRRPQKVLTEEQFEKTHNKSGKKRETREEYYEETVVDLSGMEVKPVKQNFAGFGQKTTPKIVDFEELERKTKTNYVDYNVKPVPRIEKKPGKIKEKKVQSTDMLETVVDADGNYVYTKLGDNDPTVGRLMVIVKSRKEQAKQDLALLEGKRLIRDALMAGCKLQTLFFSRKSDMDYLQDVLPKIGSKIYKIPYREIQMWSALTTSPGIIGIFKTPDVENYSPPEENSTLPLTIICDNVREPGNLGAILRTAAAAGCQRILLTKGCVDLWDPKVLRSACGAHFHARITGKLDFSEIEKRLEPDFRLFIADNKIVTSVERESSGETEPEALPLKEVVNRIPLLPYYGVDFKNAKSIVVVIGGETEGIGESAYRLALEKSGVRLNVPLNSCVESLNTGTALGVIAFEIKRQLSIM